MIRKHPVFWQAFTIASRVLGATACAIVILYLTGLDFR